MLGLRENNANKKLINLFLILAKKAVWKRRNVAKNRGFILNLRLLFKGMVEDYVQILYNYFTLENKVWNFYNIFTEDVVCIFIQKHIVMPHNDGF